MARTFRGAAHQRVTGCPALGAPRSIDDERVDAVIARTLASVGSLDDEITAAVTPKGWDEQMGGFFVKILHYSAAL